MSRDDWILGGGAEDGALRLGWTPRKAGAWRGLPGVSAATDRSRMKYSCGCRRSSETERPFLNRFVCRIVEGRVRRWLAGAVGRPRRSPDADGAVAAVVEDGVPRGVAGAALTPMRGWEDMRTVADGIGEDGA